MKLSPEQLKILVQQAICSEPDCLDCDGCFEHLAEFAEAELADKPLCEMLEAIRIHIQSCGCCREEYQALLEGLRSIDDPSSPQD